MTDLIAKARIDIGRTGGSVTTREQLSFQLAHARARDAVHDDLDVEALSKLIKSELVIETIKVTSSAQSRIEYLQNPDCGRTLSKNVHLPETNSDVVIIVADGLAARAATSHAPAVLRELLPRLSKLNLAPIVVAKFARVALQDDIGEAMKARLAILLLGERPGLQTPDSLGCYVVFGPKRGNNDAMRNCISNIHASGLSPSEAAKKIAALVHRALQIQKSGIELKEVVIAPTLAHQ